MQTKTSQHTNLRDEMFFLHYSLQIKQKLILIRYIFPPIAIQFIVKSGCKDLFASSDRRIYLPKENNATNVLSSFFCKILPKISARVLTPTHFECELHLHTKYMYLFDNKKTHYIAVEMYHLIAFFNALWRSYLPHDPCTQQNRQYQIWH